MRSYCSKLTLLGVALVLVLSIVVSGTAYAGSDILGEIQFEPSSKVERLAGVWVDGLYVGYVDELKGSKKLLLLPGEHQLTLRYAGYQELSKRVLIEPRQIQLVPVQLTRDPSVPNGDATSEMKLSVTPSRAAVFLNGGYVGHVNEFNGPGQWMLLPPGSYSLEITLPGYLPFETKIMLRPKQRFELKTELFPASIKAAGPRVNEQSTRISQAKPPD